MDAGLRYRDRLSTVVCGGRPGVALGMLLCWLVSACSSLTNTPPPRQPGTAIDPIPIPVVARIVPPAASAESSVRARPSRPAADSVSLPLIVVASSELPAYLDVAERLAALAGAEHTKLYVLEQLDARGLAELAIEINAIGARSAVAIGLEAALFASTQLSGVPVVFCQVLNYAEHDELAQAAAGVSALPSISQQFRYWKNIDDGLHRIGAITGPGHDGLLDAAQHAAEEQNLDFKHRVSQSDQETIYLFKRLASQIDGFWLIPDNRVLSLTAIREILSYAVERNVRVVVSNPGLLRYGALMSFSLSPSQIADAVFNVVETVAGKDDRSFEVFAPTRFDVEINPEIATRLGFELD